MQGGSFAVLVKRAFDRCQERVRLCPVSPCSHTDFVGSGVCGMFEMNDSSILTDHKAASGRAQAESCNKEE